MVTADTITDEQIRQVWHDYPNEITARQLMCALNEKLLLQPGWTKQEIRDARALCAEILNTHACGVNPISMEQRR
jgi:hypothetical protein